MFENKIKENINKTDLYFENNDSSSQDSLKNKGSQYFEKFSDSKNVLEKKNIPEKIWIKLLRVIYLSARLKN